MKTYLSLFALLILFGCSSSKNVQNTPSAEETENIKAGFVKGTVRVEPVGGACPYLIEVENEGEAPYFLDPVNLMEYYQKDGQKIWFKFRGLRMMNRCEKANPISISEIKDRTE